MTSIPLNIQECKNTFTGMESYKYWSSFGKNHNAMVMKLKKKSNPCDTASSSRSKLEKIRLNFSSFAILD